jgi:Domain of unknown function (DUF397)
VRHGNELPASTAITGLIWRKSTASGGDGNACVEIAWTPGLTLVRDSKDPGRRDLRFDQTAWQEFLAEIR